MTAPVVAVDTTDGRPDIGPEHVDALADDLSRSSAPAVSARYPVRSNGQVATGRRCPRSCLRRISARPTWSATREPSTWYPASSALPSRTASRHPARHGHRQLRAGHPDSSGILLDLRALTEVRIGAEHGHGGRGRAARMIDKELRLAAARNLDVPVDEASTVGGFVGGGSARAPARSCTSRVHYGCRRAVDADGRRSGMRSSFISGATTSAVHPHLRRRRGARQRVGPHRPGARLDVAVYATFDSTRGLAAGLRATGGLDPLPRLVSGDGPRWSTPCPRLGGSRPRPYSLRVSPSPDASKRCATRWPGRRSRRRGARGDSPRPTGSPAVLQPPGLVPAERGPRQRGSTWRPRARVILRPRRRPRGLRGRPPAPGGRPRAGWAMVVADVPHRSRRSAGIGKMEAIGVGVHSPHQWYVDRDVALAIETRGAPPRTAQPGQAHHLAARRLAGEHRRGPMNFAELTWPEVATLPPGTRSRSCRWADRAARPASAVVYRLRDRVGDRRGRRRPHGRPGRGAAARAGLHEVRRAHAFPGSLWLSCRTP